jgi:hypothetical protein
LTQAAAPLLNSATDQQMSVELDIELGRYSLVRLVAKTPPLREAIVSLVTELARNEAST